MASRLDALGHARYQDKAPPSGPTDANSARKAISSSSMPA
jgi:hypothetical protein